MVGLRLLYCRSRVARKGKREISQETQANGEGPQKRPGTGFDPVAGMRVMADIQAEGLRAAGELLERVLRSEPERNGNAPSPAGDYTTLVDAWGELLQRTLSGLAPGGPGAITVALDSGGVGPPVRLALDASAAEPAAAAEVWLHNGTSSAVGPVVLCCGDLRNSDNKRLKGAEVRFEPRTVQLDARSSRAIEVAVVVNGPLRAGTYRGTIQAQGAPRLWLPVEVAIEPC